MSLKPQTVYNLEGEYQNGSLNIEYLTAFNYSMYHNDNKTLIKCELTNDSESDWTDVSVSVEGQLLHARTVNINGIAAKSKVDITQSLPIEVNPDELIQLSEGITTQFTIKVVIGGCTAFEHQFPLRLMPFDQWAGANIRPELLASFVTPNHPVLARVSAAASRFMLAFTGSSDLDEYQSQDPNRVSAQVAAVYEALRSQSLIYATPPANFESDGQRVRTVDKVLDEKLGTCLDLSLLAASCLEAIGINPIIILVKGHAMVGAWLVKDTYIHPVGDDVEYLLKSASDGINEIVVFESTAITSDTPTTFDQAVASATDTLRHGEFLCFIDIYRTRVCGIRPLPLRINTDGRWHVDIEGVEHSNSTSEVKEYDRYDLTSYANDSVKLTKYNIWERKLLDFTLRNNLLNMRLGKKIIPILSFVIDKFEDYIQAGVTYKILPFPLDKPATPSPKGLYDSSEYAQLEDYVKKDLENNRIHSFLDASSLKDALKYVYRASRTSLEENGANNLYLVFGVLKWYETERSQQARYAPIILVPIEIVRSGAGGVSGSGYVIRTRDEDTVLNITLAELLKQQYNIDLTVLEELPKDESGVDVKKIFAIVRDKIRHNKGWNVLDESMIGIFSFNKFVMWNDIHTNASKLHVNPIISSLVDGKLNIDVSGEGIDAKDADSKHQPADFTIPIDVDSSQLEAVIASGAGKSFILHGPPGTGKSQTITNMIANALYQGKRVLFVAEKMAALSVVQSRLEKIGLAPFCLELHSNKVTKRHFLAQMEAALDVAHRQSPAEYKRISDEIFDLRHQLITFIEALHSKRSNDMSLYDCITSYLAIDGDALVIDFDKYKDIDRHGIERLSDKIARLDTVFLVAGQPTDSQLHDLDITNGSPEAEKLLGSCVNGLVDDIANWSAYLDKFKLSYGLDLPDDTVGIRIAIGYLELLQSMSYCSGELIRLCADGRRVQAIKSAVEAGQRAATTRRQLCDLYSPNILKLDDRDLAAKWQQACDKWFLPRYFAKRSLLQMMSAYKAGFSEVDMRAVIDSLRTVRESQEAYDGNYDMIQRTFGHLAYYEQEQWREMIDALSSLPQLYKLTTQMAVDLHQQPADLINTLAEGYRPQDLDKGIWPLMIQTGRSILSTLHQMETVAQVIGVDTNTDALSGQMLPRMQRWQRALPNFRSWFIWCKNRRELIDQCLDAVVEYITVGKHTGQEAANAFVKGLYQQIARGIIDSDSELRYFNGLMFNDLIDNYRKLTSRFQELSKTQLYCKLAANIPSQTMAAHENSEIGILKRNIKNGGRGTSIRKIIDQIPTLLPKLCPCMLMSPLSVAQYIDLDNEKFDIVIFDEASQMPTSEAVGAIARGKALIVVGDPKQMPPTSFFATSAVGEEEAYIDDMDSILDDCISLSIPSKHLTWHYRSKHESLISFSNSQYYGGRLLTFPSVDDRVSKVTLRMVGGVYDKGRSCTNVQEAQAVVAEVIRRLSDPVLSQWSIGIVSFSKVQQDKIEDLLNDELAKHPELQAVDDNRDEPIFIKNLENVQGDERDVILFSVGYGPDANGKVSMNFGPLNNSGGERRLNVAVSRARREMVVFSSLSSEQIDLRRTNALGVIGLKKFLEYAESGNNPLVADQESQTALDVIPMQIASALKSAGYDSRLNVGRSQFKIDVAVIHPERNSEFLLGILIDGPTYYGTKTVRDREIVQPTVLRMLNWNVTRVYTLDWYERQNDVINAIIAKLNDLRQGKPVDQTSKDVDSTKKTSDAPEPEPEAELQEIQMTSPGVEYKLAEIEPEGTVSTVESLELCRRTVQKQLTALVQYEQPIVNSLIYKRVVKLWGLPRVTPKLVDFVDKVLRNMRLYCQDDEGQTLVYWVSADAANDFKRFRTGSDRDISEVPSIEIANAMLYVVDQQIAIERESLKSVTAKLLGFTRMGNNINAAAERVLVKLINQGVLTEQGAKVCKK